MKIIVARHNENVAWTEAVKEHEVIVVEKAEIGNWGREPASFLHYIIENYDSLKGNYVFLQGNPFDHCPDVLEKLVYFDNGFMWLGSTNYTTDGVGNPHHNGLKVQECVDALELRVEYPVSFARGGQYCVSAHMIKRKPKSFYEKALKFIKETHQGEYCFERLWEVIFK